MSEESQNGKGFQKNNAIITTNLGIRNTKRWVHGFSDRMRCECRTYLGKVRSSLEIGFSPRSYRDEPNLVLSATSFFQLGSLATTFYPFQTDTGQASSSYVAMGFTRARRLSEVGLGIEVDLSTVSSGLLFAWL